MRRLVAQTDVVLECRDLRVPLSSRNPLFEATLRDKPRIVVFTKSDLAPAADRRKVREWFWAPPPSDQQPPASAAASLDREVLTPPMGWPGGPSVVFHEARARTATRHVLDALHRHQQTTRAVLGTRVLVVGMPNVGKSTLLNALRGVGQRDAAAGGGGGGGGGGRVKKVARTGAEAGVTRKIATAVRVLGEKGGEALDGVYVIDTPGVFVPHVPDAEVMLKLMLCGCVGDGIGDPVLLADYLLWQMNLKVGPEAYARLGYPVLAGAGTNSVKELLDFIAKRTGRLKARGRVDYEGAAMWFVRHWRKGGLGKFVLDDVDDAAPKRAREAAEKAPLSWNQARRRAKEALRQKTKARLKG